MPDTRGRGVVGAEAIRTPASEGMALRSEEHTSELQSRLHLVCRLLLEKKKTIKSLPTLPLLSDDAFRTTPTFLPAAALTSVLPLDPTPSAYRPIATFFSNT